jgi:hypothetical protein
MTNNLGYLGNPKLRKAYTQVAMSQYEIDEYIKCMEDPVYFAKTYMKIIVLGKGLQPFDLYPFQEEMIRTFIDGRFVICKIPRQSGKSITTIAFLLHTILFNESRNVAILAHKASAANGLLGRLKLAYENLPAWLQSGIIEWNKTSIELENGSKIAAYATAADGLRSGSFDCIIGSSEITIRENGMIRKTTIGQLFESEERLYSLEQRFEVLTEGGFKKFCGVRKIERNEILLEISLVTGERITCTHDHLIMTKQGWKKAIEIKEHEVKTKVGYSFVNQIKEVAPEPVYDLLEVEDVHSFYANDILVHNCILLDEFAFVPSNIADAFFESTYPVITAGDNTKIIIVSTPKGMNTFYTMWIKATTGKSDYVPIEYHWYDVPWRDEKWKEQTIRNTSQQQWDQEFGCEFLGSSNTLISGAKLQQLMATMEEPIARIEKLRIFEHAKPDHTYVLTADVSEGLGLDYSTFSIIDVTTIPYRVVATFRDNQIKPILFPTILVSTAKRYNDAFILVEINSIGLQVADMIHYDLAYENLIKIQSKGKQGQQWTPGFAKKLAFGVKTSTQTKQIGCTNLKSLIESDKLLVTDEMTIKELTNFTANKKTYKAEEGNNDDLVMTLVNFSWLMAQKFFRETVSNDVRKVLQEEQLNIIDNDIVPFGVIDNGVDDPFGDDLDAKGELWVEDRSRKYVFDNFDWNYGSKF